MFTVKNALKRIYAIKGFFSPKGFIFDTIFADLISKSSSDKDSIYLLM